MRAVAAGALLVLLVAFPEAARAERGALTVTILGGGQAGRVPTPLAAADGGTTIPSFVPVAGLAVRYALTHDFALGLSAGAEPMRSVVHRGVVLEVPDPSTGRPGTWPGDLTHDYGAFFLAAHARWYLAGFDWRIYLEPKAGVSRRVHRNLRHRQAGGGAAYPFGDLDHHVDEVVLGIAPGIEHVWDRMALGMRAEGTWRLADALPFHLRLVAYAAFDFYP